MAQPHSPPFTTSAGLEPDSQGSGARRRSSLGIFYRTAAASGQVAIGDGQDEEGEEEEEEDAKTGGATATLVPVTSPSDGEGGADGGTNGDETTPLLGARLPTATPFLSGVSPTRFWLIYTVILGTCFIACFDGTIMASSHPVITSYFGASYSASWLSTAFVLTSTAFQPLLGRLSDTLGRKWLFVIVQAVFGIATLWCAVAQSMIEFIMARALCGLGAGGMWTLGSIITSDLVPIE